MRSPLILFCLIAFAFTWALGFVIAFVWAPSGMPAYQLDLLHALGALGPTLGAVLAGYGAYGGSGLRKLRQRIFQAFPRKFTWLLILSPLILLILGLLIYAMIKGQWYDFGLFAWKYWNTPLKFAAWLLPLLSYSIFEEIGWRGFLLPHLQEKFSAWRAHLYLVGIWALWHLPFFFYRFEFSPFITLGFFMGLFVGSVLMTSLYNGSRGALFPVMLFHFLNNLASSFDKEILVAVLSTGFVLLAVGVYHRYGRQDLAPLPRVKNYFLA